MLQDIIVFDKIINLLSEEEELFNNVRGINFPVFYEETTSPRYHQYCHSLLGRSKILKKENGFVNSDFWWPPIEKFFQRVCRDNNIKVKNIYRAAINNTTYDSDMHGDIHTDHEFDHYNFLMYLNDFDLGYTYLFNQNKNMTHIIIPKKNKVVIFNGCPHAQGFCRPGQRRVVLVITFGMEE